MLLDLDLETLGELIVQTTKDAIAPFQVRIAVLEAELVRVKSATPEVPDQSMLLERIAIVAAGLSRFDVQAAEITELKSVAVKSAELSTRVVELETKVGIPGPPGRDGADGKDAQAIDVDLVAQKAAALMPAPKDGTDGRSVNVADLSPLIAAEVERAVAAIPRPVDGIAGRDGVAGQDGKSVTVADVLPLIVVEVEKSVAALPRPKDGVGLAGAVIDREGDLVLTLSDGSTKALGSVVGEVDMEAVARLIAEHVDLFPRPKDGAAGVNGKDGTLEHLTMQFNGERTVTFCFKDGTPIDGGTFTLPTVIYRGVFVAGKSYDKGDSVTFGGSVWIAHAATTAKPAEGKDWQLAVRAGREGRKGDQGIVGDRGPKGDKGEPGIYR